MKLTLLVFGLMLTGCSVPNLLFLGSALQGFEDGPVSAAKFDQPIVTYSTGTLPGLFIADTENNRIRRLSPDGLVTTFAGTGQNLTENLEAGHQADKLTAVFIPSALTIHNDKLYFTSPGCIRMIDLQQNSSIQTLYGRCLTLQDLQANNQLQYPSEFHPMEWLHLKSMIFDKQENLFVATLDRVYRISKTGKIDKIQAYFRNLVGLVMGFNGRPYVIHDKNPLPPGGPLDSLPSAHEVQEILANNQIQEVAQWPFWISTVSNNHSGKIVFTENGQLYEVDKDLKPYPIYSFKKNLDVQSLSVGPNDSNYYFSDYTAIYQIKIPDKK